MTKLELAVAHPAALCSLFPDQIGTWGVGFCWGRKTGEKSSQQSSFDVKSRVQTWTKLVGGEYWHHCAILMLMLYLILLRKCRFVMFTSGSISDDFSILFVYKWLMKEMCFSSQRDILVESVARSLLPSATLHDILSECALIWVAGNGNVLCATKHSAIRLVYSNISTLIQERGRISVLSAQRHSIVQMTCEDTAEFTQVIM